MKYNRRSTDLIGSDIEYWADKVQSEKELPKFEQINLVNDAIAQLKSRRKPLFY